MKQSLLIISTILSALFVVASVFIFRSHTETEKSQSASDGKINVSATFYPLGEFARKVGGDAADVSVIVSPGVEPHEYEPTPQDIASIYASDVFIVNGAGIDAWATKIQPDLESKGVRVLVMSQVLGFDKGDNSEADGSLKTDPHFWLNPILAEREVESIKNIFAEVDSRRKNIYNEHANAYIQSLQNLDKKYREGLSSCGKNTIITSHNAFGYLAKQYGFESLSISGFSAEAEPSNRELADLSSLAKQKNIKHIFFETLVSPKLAETLADEVGAKTLAFNPLEGLTNEEVSQGKNYISVMEENLGNLQIAMECR